MPGPRTNEQIAQRIEFARELLIEPIHYGEIKARMREAFGSMSHQCIHRYVCRARELMASERMANLSQLRAQAIARYEAIMRDPKARPIERIKAQERIDQINGIDAPRRAEVAVEVLHAHPKLKPETIRRAIDFCRAPLLITNGNGHSGNGHAGNGN